MMMSHTAQQQRLTRAGNRTMADGKETTTLTLQKSFRHLIFPVLFFLLSLNFLLSLFFLSEALS